MFKTTITLKQHTPIIHFQHDQEGATLRATEVKPKLDKFIIQKTGKAWKDIDNAWKVGGGVEKQQALNYKIKIEIDPGKILSRDIETERYDHRKQEMVEEKHPLFFANIKEDNPKRFTESSGLIKLTILSFSKDLLSFIKDQLESFFLYHNFGTRQTKGFGNFLPENISFPNAFYSFSIPTKDLKVVFATVELFYKTLRSGLNGASMPDGSTRFLKEFYMKPLIWQYAADKKISWEKRGIKAKYFNNFLYKQQYQKDDKNKEEKYKKNEKLADFEPTPLHWDNSQSKIVRDWLGLSTEQAWRGYPGAKGQATISKTHIDKQGNEIKSDNAIARMKSPILFKPVEVQGGYRVYFCAIKDKETEQKFAEANFKVKNNGSGDLKMNVWSDFDLDDFLKFSFDPNRIENSFHPNNIRKGSDGEKIYKEIIRIYNEIRKSKND